jgi:hypothetical protein
MLNFTNVPATIDFTKRYRALHQRNVEFQKRFAMENYLQDHVSELAEHWIEASDDEYNRVDLTAGSIIMVLLYGC